MDKADLKPFNFNDPLPREYLLNILGIHIATHNNQFFLARKIVCDAPVHKVSCVKDLFHIVEVKFNLILIAGVLSVFVFTPMAFGLSDAYRGNIYQVGTLKPIDSVLKLKAGDRAPDFTLSSVSGEKISLSQFRGEKNVVLSFVPAAWTPVCSDQWPGYNIAKDIFSQQDAILLGMTVDNIPTLFAWTNQMGQLWFPVLSLGLRLRQKLS